MTDRGVFCIARSAFDHPFFKKEPFTEREAWWWLIGEAAFAPTKVRVGRAMFELERGQLVHAIRFMAQRWQWTEPRVRRFLERLRRQTMLDVRASAEATVLTICNYGEYQFGRRAADEPATSSRRREEEPQEPKDLGGSDARARAAPMISQAAMALADEIAVIAGHDLAFLPLKWVSDGPGYRVQMMLNAGWDAAMMREVARAAMAKKRDGSPFTIRYFEKIFERAHAPRLPLPAAKVVSSQGGSDAASAHPQPQGDWRARRDKQHDARAELRAFVAAHTDGGGDSGSDGGRPPLRVVPDAGRR